MQSANWRGKMRETCVIKAQNLRLRRRRTTSFKLCSSGTERSSDVSGYAGP